MATHVEGTCGRIGREWTLDMPSSLFFFEHAMQMPESWYGSGRMSLSYLTKIEDSAFYTLLQGALSAFNTLSHPDSSLVSLTTSCNQDPSV